MRVTLNGIVSSDDDRLIYEWFGYRAFSPEQVRDAIAQNPAGEDLVLEINSPGGSVFAGSEMYSILRSCSIPTRDGYKRVCKDGPILYKEEIVW